MTTTKKAVGANRTASNQNSQAYFNSKTAQRKRILDHLIAHGYLTTTDARQSLDIMHPAGRILELRQQGVGIRTDWKTIDTGINKHRLARYVLTKFNGDNSNE